MSTADRALSGLSTDELRAMVRSVLRDVLPAGPTTAAQTAAPSAASGPLTGEVAVATEADLSALIARIASLCEDPTQRAALRDGRHGFRLTNGHATAARPTRPTGSVLRVERGAVTERVVVKAAAEGARLVLGAKAVLTPLAKDKARVLGVDIEKER